MQSPTTIRTISKRHGLVLIVVLVVIVLLSLGAYTFSEFMLIENKAAFRHVQQVQAKALADSGVDYVAAILSDRASLSSVGLYHNPGMFQGVNVLNAGATSSAGRFSIVSAVEGDLSSRRVRFGLLDESSKLNINVIANLVPASSSSSSSSGSGSGNGTGGGNQNGTGGGNGSGSGSGSSTSTGTPTNLANPLMGLPGMTQEISEAIFDWIDSDDTARDYGVETEYYQSQVPPYQAKNGPLETIDELLLVRGVTPALLFGEDANRNGILDPNENDGMLSAPPDNQDGILDRGWSAYLTVFSREHNVQPDHTPKLNVNTNTLSELYDKLEEMYGQKQAQYVIAYRVYGPMQQVTQGTGGGSGATSQISQRLASSGIGNTSGVSQITGNSAGSAISSSGVTSIGGSGGGRTGGANTSTQVLTGLARNIGSAAATGGQVTRGGIDVTNGGSTVIKSLYELVGTKVQGNVNGSRTILESPWSDNPGDIQQYMPDLLEKMSISGETYLDGRINVNQAHLEVIRGLPNMTEEIAAAIVSAQLRGPNGEPLSEADNSRATTAWLVADQIVDLETMVQLDQYITARGDVFRMQVVGDFESGGPGVRVEAVIDATQIPPQIKFFRDLSDLGKGYSFPRSR